MAKKLALPRATAYLLLEQLIEKGLVSKAPQRNTTLFLANLLSALSGLLRREKDLAQGRLDLAARGVEDLAKMQAPV